MQVFSEYVESHAKVMSENTYENEITYLTHCVVYEETCFNVWDFSVSKAKLIELLCVPLCVRGQSAPQVSMGSSNSESKTLRPEPCLCLVGALTRYRCASCVSSRVVAGWHVWRAHTPPGNVLCQVFILLQQLWCLHPSLLPPWVRTAWVPWTWGLCLAASTPLVHVEPWWGGDWKRKTSKAHVSGMVASAVWPGESVWAG